MINDCQLHESLYPLLRKMKNGALQMNEEKMTFADQLKEISTQVKTEKDQILSKAVEKAWYKIQALCEQEARKGRNEASITEIVRNDELELLEANNKSDATNPFNDYDLTESFRSAIEKKAKGEGLKWEVSGFGCYLYRVSW